jgi:hypothetical protein
MIFLTDVKSYRRKHPVLVISRAFPCGGREVSSLKARLHSGDGLSTGVVKHITVDRARHPSNRIHYSNNVELARLD